MCLKGIRNYFDKLGKKEKIQSKGMEKAIERSKDIKEAYLQGGKAVGEIVKKGKERREGKIEHNS